MKQAKKGPFDASIDLTQIPGYAARFNTAGNIGQQVNIKLESCDLSDAADATKNLRAKFRSGTDVRSLPSVILRRKGQKV